MAEKLCVLNKIPKYKKLDQGLMYYSGSQFQTLGKDLASGEYMISIGNDGMSLVASEPAALFTTLDNTYFKMNSNNTALTMPSSNERGIVPMFTASSTFAALKIPKNDNKWKLFKNGEFMDRNKLTSFMSASNPGIIVNTAENGNIEIWSPKDSKTYGFSYNTNTKKPYMTAIGLNSLGISMPTKNELYGLTQDNDNLVSLAKVDLSNIGNLTYKDYTLTYNADKGNIISNTGTDIHTLFNVTPSISLVSGKIYMCFIDISFGFGNIEGFYDTENSFVIKNSTDIVLECKFSEQRYQSFHGTYILPCTSAKVLPFNVTITIPDNSECTITNFGIKMLQLN